jgi:L-asparaginase
MEKASKILLLLTGGTIGSSINNGCIDVNHDAGQDLLSAYYTQCNHSVDFEVIQPYTILSENSEPKNWLQIIQTLDSYDLNHYSGVIITHGSDTLPYTSAALCYGLDTPPIPIVLVAANYALSEPYSNGLINFTNSVNFIVNQHLPGFYVIYQNSDQQIYVHLASRLLEADWIHDDFQSFGNTPLGILDQRGFCCTPSPLNPKLIQLNNLNPDMVPLTQSFKNEILGLRAYPGLNYQTICLNQHPIKAILHSLYHCGSGNVTSNSDTSLLEFIKANPQVDHYLISFKNIKNDLYSSCLQLINAGAIPLENISFESSIAKLNFAYNQNEYSPYDYMKREFFYEFVREKPENGYVV